MRCRFTSVFRLPVHLEQHLETDGAERDEQADDDEERDQQLGVHRGGHSRDEPREQAHQRPLAREGAIGGRATSRRVEPDAHVLDAEDALRSTSEVRKVWSTSPRAVLRANTPYRRVTSWICLGVPVRNVKPGPFARCAFA